MYLICTSNFCYLYKYSLILVLYIIALLDTFIMKSISLGINKTIEMFNYNSEDKNPDFIEKNNNEIINIIEAADFTFQAFAPQNFLNFRNLQNINEIFNNSFKTSPLTTKKNTGKSKSLFYYTTDRKFVIKTMSSTEKEVLISLLSEYFSHFCEHPNTLLPKLLGSYRFKDTRSEYYLIVMTNIYPYPMDKTLNRIYDLKGSIFNREASIQEESEINFRLLDVDFRHHFNDGLRIPLSVHSLLAETLENDCELLKKYNIMDYSLLVVIKIVENENYEGEKAATTEENSLDTFVSPKNSEVSGQNIVTNEMTLPCSQSQNFSNGLSVTFINNKHELQKLSVYIGIIDILQTYNWKRKVENIVKCKLCILGDLATIQNPAKYAIRFKQFLTMYKL